MSHTISIDQASTQLRGLVSALGPDDEIILVDNNRPVARIVPNAIPNKRTAGTCKGMIEIIDDSNDVILQQFKDYMP